MGEENSNLFNFLLCHESNSCLNENEETRSQHDVLCFVEIGDKEEEEEEYVSQLARRECHQGKTSSFQVSLVRTAAIDWIIMTGAKFGFCNQTSYLAISYFDLFMTHRFINESEPWGIRLCSLACLSLAAKMEETVAPRLSQFPQEDFAFRLVVIRKTELLILATLKWKTNLVTPYNYLHYFVTKFSQDHRSNILSRSSESLLDVIKEISFTDHLQFVVAAAAVLAALDCKLTKEEIEIKLDSITWWISTENKNVFSCYRKMQEMKQRTPVSAVSPGLQPVVLPDSCIGLKCGTKRRLLFDDSDQTCSSQEKRLLLNDFHFDV